MENSLYPTSAEFNGIHGTEFVATIASDTTPLIHAVSFASGVNGAGLYGAALMAFHALDALGFVNVRTIGKVTA